MTRKQHDRYLTPDALASAIVARTALRGLLRGVVVEPSCGDGAFLRAVSEVRAAPVTNILGVDIDPGAGAIAWRDGERAPEDPTRAIVEDDWMRLRWDADLVVMNPPYCDAEDHIRHALEQSRAVVALVRQSFLASGERVIRGWSKHHASPLWRQHQPAYVDLVAPRPSFTGGATDGAEYALVTWTRTAVTTELDWLIWRTHKRARSVA